MTAYENPELPPKPGEYPPDKPPEPTANKPGEYLQPATPGQKPKPDVAPMPLQSSDPKKDPKTGEDLSKQKKPEDATKPEVNPVQGVTPMPGDE